jgi:Uma2 family endonuclease
MTARFEPSYKNAPELLHFSGERYDQLWALGVLTSDDRVELLDGQIVRKPEVNSSHWHALHELHKYLLLLFGPRALVANQSTIRLPQDGRPDPDIMLIRPDLPRDRVPGPEDTYLVIEIADTTLDRDRTHKLPLYARDGIQEYWILDLEHQQLEMYRAPDGDQYASKTTLKTGQAARCLEFPNDSIEWWVNS